MQFILYDSSMQILVVHLPSANTYTFRSDWVIRCVVKQECPVRGGLSQLFTRMYTSTLTGLNLLWNGL